MNPQPALLEARKKLRKRGHPTVLEQDVARFAFWVVERRLGVSRDQLVSPERTKTVNHGRAVVVRTCRACTGMSLQELGDILNRDHTTILHIEREMQVPHAVNLLIGETIAAAFKLAASPAGPTPDEKLQRVAVEVVAEVARVEKSLQAQDPKPVGAKQKDAEPEPAKSAMADSAAAVAAHAALPAAVAETYDRPLLNTIARAFACHIDELRGGRGKWNDGKTNRALAALSLREAGLSYPEIAEALACGSHSTVMQMEQRAKFLIRHDLRLYRKYRTARRALEVRGVHLGPPIPEEAV